MNNLEILAVETCSRLGLKGRSMKANDMNRAIRLADELIDELRDGTDNAAELLAGIAIAIRRLQGYNDYLIFSFNPTLRDIPTRGGEE